jgi:two-component system CheB/CheR fusion protein
MTDGPHALAKASTLPPTKHLQRGLRPKADFPVVGIGASAGGLAAFEAFFSGLPEGEDPGMAFVLVQHLAPDHKSLLCALIRRYTRMQVVEVEDGMPVQVNCVYVIAPNATMTLAQGVLHLQAPLEPHGQRLPIDHFFTSLAQDQGERAMGIVLSGTGADGTLGVRAIKQAGGMVMAQSNAEPEFEGMPHSAIATGLVDYQLPPADMPAQLKASHLQGSQLQASHLQAALSPTAGARPHGTGASAAQSASALRKTFALLNAQTGHDFSQYKPSTIQRRMERRMAAHHLHSMADYVQLLERTPTEVQALFQDFLIGVTQFFRDPDAFELLQTQVLPALFKGKPEGATVRVWCAGCSTGEEAYSLAMVLVEHMAALKQNYVLQVFATDIDSRAIATARAGIYPLGIAAHISPQRLERFFALEPGGQSYRIRKGIRDVLVFSEQDLVKDPPFSRLDLISCRNLLIYLTAGLQKRLIPLFHYALVPGGCLVLGNSEGVGEFDGLFAGLDPKAKVYLRKDSVQGAQRAALSRAIVPLMAPTPARVAHSAAHAKRGTTPPVRELMEQALLRQVTPASVMVNARGDMVYVHGHTGMYLEASQGEAGVQNILKMARPGLRPALSTALHQAVQGPHIARASKLKLSTHGQDRYVNLTVQQVASSDPQAAETALYLVTLEDSPAPEPSLNTVAAPGTPELSLDAQARIHALTQELRDKDDYLQRTHEQLESSNEDLKSSVEEMQSVNEELQSTNEELETSKEELQSVNEELATVNTELQTKVLDLVRSNNDMNNLLAGTGVGTVFVDQQLRILRFTPAASSIIHLIPSDLGRSVGHIVSKLVAYRSLEEDARAVLQSLVPKALEVQTTNHAWYTLRIQPYRTLDNVVEGAVISFEDITEMVRARLALEKANDLLRLAVVVRDSHDAITVQDLAGQTLAWNPGAVRLYGWSEADALKMNVRERIPEKLREGALATLERLSRAEVLQPYKTQRLSQSGRVLNVSIVSTALMDAQGTMYGIATTERAKGPVAA